MKLEVVINYDERTAIVWIVKADKSYDLVTYTAKKTVHYAEYAKTYAQNVASVIDCAVEIIIKE